MDKKAKAAQLKARAAERLSREISHAIIRLGEYTVPLIGIAPVEVLEQCDLCHDLFSIQQIQLTGTQFLCPKCRENTLTA